MFQPIEDIEGLEGPQAYRDVSLQDDTPPDAIIARFYVRSVEMPALTAKNNGIPVEKTFVYLEVTFELGKSVVIRRIRDDVEYSPEKEKWIVKKLALKSDIERFKKEWNMFNRSCGSEYSGTALSVLFRHDPSRVNFYQRHSVMTVEMLASVNQTDLESLGMGSREDQARAQLFLKRIKSDGAAIELKSQLDERDRQFALLQSQFNELSNRLSDVVEDQEEKKIKEKRVRKTYTRRVTQ